MGRSMTKILKYRRLFVFLVTILVFVNFEMLNFAFLNSLFSNQINQNTTKKTNNDKMNHPTKYFCKDGKKPCEASGYDSEKANDYYKGAKTRLAVSYATLATGAVMAVTGVVLVIYDVVKIQPQLEELNRGRSFNLSPVVSPDFSGFALTGTF